MEEPSARFWQRLLQDLARSLSKRLPPDEIDDIVQDIVLRLVPLHGAIAASRPPRKFYAFAWVLAHHYVADWHRKNRLHRTQTSKETRLRQVASDAARVEDPGTLDRRCWSDVIAIADRVRATLSRRQLRVFDYVLENWPTTRSQIARALRMSATDVGEVLRAIGRKIRGFLPPPNGHR